MRIGKWWIVPAANGVPADLPPWARDELVRRRVTESALQAEITRLRVEAVDSQGGSMGAKLAEIMRPWETWS
jgi:hypothetical protein